MQRTLPGTSSNRCSSHTLELCRFYFAYCEAAFDARYIHNFQILWQKSAEPQELPSALTPSRSEELCKPLPLITPMQSAPSDPITQVRHSSLQRHFIGAVYGIDSTMAHS